MVHLSSFILSCSLVTQDLMGLIVILNVILNKPLPETMLTHDHMASLDHNGLNEYDGHEAVTSSRHVTS